MVALLNNATRRLSVSCSFASRPRLDLGQLRCRYSLNNSFKGYILYLVLLLEI